MGSFIKENGNIYTKGTEIGAFVRLDDLDKAYSLLSVDRAIFYNPEKLTLVLSFQFQALQLQ